MTDADGLPEDGTKSTGLEKVQKGDGGSQEVSHYHLHNINNFIWKTGALAYNKYFIILCQ